MYVRLGLVWAGATTWPHSYTWLFVVVEMINAIYDNDDDDVENGGEENEAKEEEEEEEEQVIFLDPLFLQTIFD